MYSANLNRILFTAHILHQLLELLILQPLGTHTIAKGIRAASALAEATPTTTQCQGQGCRQQCKQEVPLQVTCEKFILVQDVSRTNFTAIIPVNQIRYQHLSPTIDIICTFRWCIHLDSSPSLKYECLR
jgi:hypothetical protein